MDTTRTAHLWKAPGHGLSSTYGGPGQRSLPFLSWMAEALGSAQEKKKVYIESLNNSGQQRGFNMDLEEAILLYCSVKESQTLPNSTVFSIIIILLCHWNAGVFQNIQAYLLSCWNDSTGGKGHLFFFFGDESIIGKKNQDTNSQFWCFPDLLEALIPSTRIRNTDIYKEGQATAPTTNPSSILWLRFMLKVQH